MKPGGIRLTLGRAAASLVVLALPLLAGDPGTPVVSEDAAKRREIMWLISTHPHPMVRHDMIEAIESGRMALSFHPCEWDSAGERVRALLTCISEFGVRRYELNFCPEFFDTTNLLMNRYATVLHEWVHYQQYEEQGEWYDRTFTSSTPRTSARASFEREVEATAAAAKFACVMMDPSERNWSQSMYCDRRLIDFRRRLARDLFLDPRFRDDTAWVKVCAKYPWSRFPRLKFL